MNTGQQFAQAARDLLDLRCKSSVALKVRGSELCRSLGFDGLPDRLCLCEVDPSVHEGAISELAGFGNPRTKSNKEFHQCRYRRRRAVDGEFGRQLARIATPSFKRKHNPIVAGGVPAVSALQMAGLLRKARKCSGGNLPGVRSGHANDRNGSRCGCCDWGTNGVEEGFGQGFGRFKGIR